MPTELLCQLKELEEAGTLELPGLGGGRTAERLMTLFDLGARDLSLARVAEAHLDAKSILAEAGVPARDNIFYGVWASESPGSQVLLTMEANGELFLDGEKRFCTGATFLDRALITARETDGPGLFDVDLRLPGITVHQSTWATAAFADTGTSCVSFSRVRLSNDARVGTANWYLTRPGFWAGALGPAACWAGGAAGLCTAALHAGINNVHGRAQLGALRANVWGSKAILRQAAIEIDRAPADIPRLEKVALMARHLIERNCTDTLDRFGRATGPRLLAFDEEASRRHAELSLYIRQCHAERDLETLDSLNTTASSSVPP